MPMYFYKCHVCQGERPVIHGMNENRTETCTCGNIMHKVPQPFAVNWNGPKPSQGGVHPIVQQLNSTFDERRDAYFKRKEENVSLKS